MTYYAEASLEHWLTRAEPLNFVIPTGNLGNAMGTALTRAPGLPVGRIALATNAGHVMPDFFDAANTSQAPASPLANAMDVGAPSNLSAIALAVSG